MSPHCVCEHHYLPVSMHRCSDLPLRDSLEPCILFMLALPCRRMRSHVQLQQLRVCGAWLPFRTVLQPNKLCLPMLSRPELLVRNHMESDHLSMQCLPEQCMSTDLQHRYLRFQHPCLHGSPAIQSNQLWLPMPSCPELLVRHCLERRHLYLLRLPNSLRTHLQLGSLRLQLPHLQLTADLQQCQLRLSMPSCPDLSLWHSLERCHLRLLRLPHSLRTYLQQQLLRF